MTPSARHLIAYIILAICGCLILFSATNPDSIPSAVFIAVFIILYGIIYSGAALVGLAMRRFGVLEWDRTRVHKTAFAVASYPVFLIILQSIGQLTVRDVILVTGFFVLGYLYVGRAFLAPNHTG